MNREKLTEYAELIFLGPIFAVVAIVVVCIVTQIQN